MESHFSSGKNRTFTATTLEYGAVALCYRLRSYSESVTRVTTRAPVLNYSALVSFLRTALPKCMINEGYGRHTSCEALYKSKKCDDRRRIWPPYAVRGAGKAASEGVDVGFDQQGWRARDRSSADLPEHCEFERQIAESIAANRANRDAAAH